MAVAQLLAAVQLMAAVPDVVLLLVAVLDVVQLLVAVLDVVQLLVAVLVAVPDVAPVAVPVEHAAEAAVPAEGADGAEAAAVPPRQWERTTPRTSATSWSCPRIPARRATPSTWAKAITRTKKSWASWATASC